MPDSPCENTVFGGGANSTCVSAFRGVSRRSWSQRDDVTVHATVRDKSNQRAAKMLNSAIFVYMVSVTDTETQNLTPNRQQRLGKGFPLKGRNLEQDQTKSISGQSADFESKNNLKSRDCVPGSVFQGCCVVRLPQDSMMSRVRRCEGADRSPFCTNLNN